MADGLGVVLVLVLVLVLGAQRFRIEDDTENEISLPQIALLIGATFNHTRRARSGSARLTISSKRLIWLQQRL
jgi:hypothetical protein